MGLLFDLCRERVTALQAAERYGMQFGRNRRAICPWHDDRHPDLAFYDNGARCYCHACHNGGDAVALVAQLFSLTPIEAARKVNVDFGLGYDDDAPIPMNLGPSRSEIRRNLENWRRQRWAYLCDVERQAQAELEKAPDWDSPRFVQVLQALTRARNELEQLQNATTEELELMAAYE